MGEIDSKKVYQDIGDAVGMPDDEDKQRIRGIIARYERKHPGEIAFHRDAAKEHLGVGATGSGNKYGLVSAVTGETNSARRYLFELPPELHEKIEAYMPTIFRSKKHFAWFCKNFKELMIAEKY